MIYPTISSLLGKVDSRYTLVMVTAKRARQLVEEGSKFSRPDSDKPVSSAIDEVYNNKITYVRTRSGIK